MEKQNLKEESIEFYNQVSGSFTTLRGISSNLLCCRSAGCIADPIHCFDKRIQQKLT